MIATKLPVPVQTPIHLVGIGGAGMSSLALVLHQAGYRVTGSDLHLTPTVERMRADGIAVSIGHDSANVPPGSIVIRSTAVPETNVEVERARRCGLKVLKLAEFVGLLSAVRRTLAVAGTHGKTTTTAMLASIVIEAGLDPTALIGGIVPSLGSGARLGSSDLLIVEADEYDRRFLHLHPEIAVVTNVEADHLDYYGDLAAIVDAFRAFLNAVPDDGWIILCADSPLAARLSDVKSEISLTYGLGADAEWRAVGISRNEVGGNDFYVFAHETLVGQFRLRVPGLHNVTNALAATVAAGRIGVDFTTAATALEKFSTVRRRLEHKGEAAGVLVLDDYAHHPTEIRTDLAALREQYEGRIICLFQPHTYHRLQSLFDAFANALSNADVVVVSDVYAPAGRGPSSGDRTSEDLARAIVGTTVRYGGDLQSSIKTTAGLVGRGDVVVTMGAGDVTMAGPEILGILAQGDT